MSICKSVVLNFGRISRLLLPFGLVFTIALAVRLPFVLHSETMVHSDEGIVGLMAQDIAHGRQFPVYFYGQRYMGALEAYCIAALSPIVDSPVVGLRLGPAVVFGLLAAAQFGLLRCWFGTRRAILGVATLLLASPAFVQWSIAARGGYVEIFLWGTLFWWLYFQAVCNQPRVTAFVQAGLGLLFGSGMWINPMMLAFALPVAAHAFYQRGIGPLREHAVIGAGMRRIDQWFSSWPLTAIALSGLALLSLNIVFPVSVKSTGVHYRILLGLVPTAVGLLLVGAAAVASMVWIVRVLRPLAWLRRQATVVAPFVLGVMVGYAPTIVYVLGRTLRGQELDDSLPMAIRPLWTIGETVGYLWQGVPILFGADVRSFLEVVLVGRDYRVYTLDDSLGCALQIVHALSLGCLGLVTTLLVGRCRKELVGILRLESVDISAPTFLLLAGSAFVGLYLISACAFDFTSIRYLVPLWTVVPGMVAAVSLWWTRIRVIPVATVLLLISWSMGQLCYFAQLGAPHPLSRLAEELPRRGIRLAVAEPYDAHMISFLSEQRVRCVEFLPFWNRLEHFRKQVRPGEPVTYLVHASDRDWTGDWKWPGPAPAETRRRLWPKLQWWCGEHPEMLISRCEVVDGFELWTLAEPIPELPAG